jgi:imidazolonepropionase-like amidohydrolase
MAARESAPFALLKNLRKNGGAPFALLIVLTLLLAGCKPPEQPAVTSIVGAVLIDGTGGPPISDSLVTIESGRIRAAGSRANLLIPPEAEKIDGAGKFLVPAVIDVAERAQKANLTFPSVSSLRDARSAVDAGAMVCLHMIGDTDALDPAFVTRLRDLRIVFVPMLAEERDPARLAVAKRNTRRLTDAGVLMAVGSSGDSYREMEMLVEAGLSPTDVLVAATRNGAQALGTLNDEGAIEAGKRANLLLLTANPAEDIRNMRKTGGEMREGRWLTRTNLSP